MDAIAKIIASLPTEVIIRIVPIAAILLVVFWLMKYITALSDRLEKQSEALNKLSTYISALIGGRRDD